MWIPFTDGVFDFHGRSSNDWVLLLGITESYPYVNAYHATQLVLDGEGVLYPESTGKINHLKIKEFMIL